ncbi:divalent-cation tolerance protein CutA [Actinorugispora endophytica]|uniref:Periplasmic divalent cation tolerance protein n=1 Tax=Actinorugispora endophytica TaxID=1605990 RepID=A0A4R6V416_9ACTN|nr:divalent-cation tolerance protein CutA [Actinorugispora endophytica]TDQ52939.1 periplasmic divalent cation tolerance protein [Actinorugispora endophytica]
MTYADGGAEHVRVEVATDGRASALELGDGAVRAGLAACAQVSGPVTSVYRWAGEVRTDEEWRLVLKTAGDRLAELTAHIADRHPYDVPEIVAVPVEGGHPEYLEWVTESTRPRP